MNEIVLKGSDKNIPSKNDSGSVMDKFNTVMQLIEVTDILKELNELKKTENQHKQAMQMMEIKKNRWDVVLNIRVKERSYFQRSVSNHINSTADIKEKLLLYDKWLESIRSPLINPDEILF